jgi:hypothetical protein
VMMIAVIISRTCGLRQAAPLSKAAVIIGYNSVALCKSEHKRMLNAQVDEYYAVFPVDLGSLAEASRRSTGG